MNPPAQPTKKYQRIQDIKNVNSSQSMKVASFAKNNKIVDSASASTGQYSSYRQQSAHETSQLRSALCEAIEENQLLRQRVMELEALLAQSQDRIESLQQKYVSDMNMLQRGNREREGICTQPLQRSRSL